MLHIIRIFIPFPLTIAQKLNRLLQKFQDENNPDLPDRFAFKVVKDQQLDNEDVHEKVKDQSDAGLSNAVTAHAIQHTKMVILYDQPVENAFTLELKRLGKQVAFVFLHLE